MLIITESRPTIYLSILDGSRLSLIFFKIMDHQLREVLPTCTFFHTFSVCQLDVDLVNRTLDARSATLVSCYLPSLCTGFHCCVNVPDLNMSFSAYLSVDPCNYLFTIGIEKFTFNKSLDHYTFGKY